MPITTPFFHATNSNEPNDLTLIASVKGVGTIVSNAVGSQPAIYAITITYDLGAGNMEKKLTYDSLTALNTDFASLVSNLSTTI